MMAEFRAGSRFETARALEDFANLSKQLRQNQEKGFFGQLFG